MKLLLLSGACATLVAGGLCVTAPTAMACPVGTVPSDFSGVCVSGASAGESGGDQPVNPVAPAGGAVFGGGVGELPTVNGIPCTPQHLGTCIGLSESEQ